MTARFALVESNTTGSGRQFCAAARAMGLHPVVLTAAPERYPYLDADGIDRQVLDTGDVAAVLAACRQLADSAGLAGVTSSSEYFIATAAAVAAKLDLPAPDPVALTHCRHKDRQRATLSAAGVAVPAWRAVTGPDDAVRAATDLGFPVVVKPTTGSGSVGVRLCAGGDDVAAHTAALLAAPGNERGDAMPAVVLVERYVDGAEFSVETFGGAVVAVVGKHLGAAPYFVETGHDFPAPVTPDLRAALAATTTRALAALGLGWGAAHTELRLGPGGPVVIEVNPRLAGGMIPTLIRLGTGIDLVAAVVAGACGARPAVDAARSGHTAIRFALAGVAGTVAAIHGTQEARTGDGVALVETTVAAGSRITVTHSFRDRFGYAIATGDDAATAAVRAERAAACLRIDLC